MISGVIKGLGLAVAFVMRSGSTAVLRTTFFEFYSAESQVPAAEDVVTPLQENLLTSFISRFLPAGHDLLETVVTLAVVSVLALVSYLIGRWVVKVVVDRVVRRTRTSWDESLQDVGFFQRLVPVLPAVIMHWGILLVPHLTLPTYILVQRLALATIVLLLVRAVGTLLVAINTIYQRYPLSRKHPIKGYLQVVKVLAYIAGGILVMAILMDQSPWFFLSGMGAMMAIIMLIFRDTLLSFVAGIQLVNNDVIRVGDWIEMPQFNADGDVIDIALNVVTVRNWDNTMTVIPTHKFLEHSFKNWRSMHETGGRRIMRSIYIDMTSIRFLTGEEIERFSRFLLLKDYMKTKADELEAYNREHCPPELADVVTNCRRLTNVGTFRAYVTRYLRRHPMIHKDLIFLIRQLQPTSKGLPIEIYVFVSDTRWTIYEGVQADIFDHLLAALGEFGLRVFQEPTGHDLALIAKSPAQRPAS